jgi:sigma-E factor negative regulatory protein RseC
MLQEKGTVISTSGNRAKVAIVRSEACGSCPSKGVCSTGSGNLNVLEVRNPVEANPGEKVIIDLQPGTLLKATALVYLLPATAMVAGATAVWLKTGTDLGAMIGALAGLAATTLFLFLHGRRKNAVKEPFISKIVSQLGVPAEGHEHVPC